MGPARWPGAPLLIPATPPTLATRPVTSAMSKSLAENLVQPATTALSARDFDIKSATGVGAAPQRGDGGTARVRGAGERVVSRVGAGRYSAGAGRQKRARSRSESWVGSVVGGISRGWDQSRAVSRSVRTVKSTAARHALGWVKPSSAPASPRVRTPGSNAAPAERAVARCNE